MSFSVLLVVLAGALLHASWNLLIKTGSDTRRMTAWVYSGAGVLAAAALPFLPPLSGAAWPYLAASAGVEVLYGVLLAAAYQIGDLSLAYPLMRGTAPLLVALGSGVFVGEHLSPSVWLGVLLVSGGILLMMSDARPHGHAGAATRLALLNALIIATYTMIDGLGVRASGQALTYGAWIFLLTGIPWFIWALWRDGPRLPLRGLAIAGGGGACSLLSYTAALWAMTRAPVAAVAAVRETAIVFATALGVLVLHERVSLARLAAVLAIVIGVWRIRSG